MHSVAIPAFFSTREKARIYWGPRPSRPNPCEDCGGYHDPRPDGLCSCDACARGMRSTALIDGFCYECDPG